ncbi:MAG: right-handed parallel beta-helix repeat-containing protein [Xanthomonadales bacterium]|nr:right-handed parallel beta-helix repeat-containing protein [Xanthomonadales bacterium]
MKKLIVSLLLSSALAKAGSDVVFINGFEALNLWSNPASWGSNVVPVADEIVTIPLGQTIYLDVNTAALSELNIQGELIFLRQNLSLTSDVINLTGALQIGTAAQPFAQQATINLTGAFADGDMTRGLMVQGGRLELHGRVPQPVWTKINQHIQVGDQQIELQESANWQSGDTVILAPTDYYGVAETETFEVSDGTAAQLNLTTPVNNFRWGLLQYATTGGMNTMAGNDVTPPATEGFTPTVLDERAAIANLSRNIVIQAPDDADWQNHGFGAHLMIMGLQSEVRIDGVEFNRVGHAGQLGRYPVHWHRLSYDDNAWLGDVQGHYIKNSSIHDSQNRCITIHATNGLLIDNNICYDILGHGIFLEDAVERRNTITHNLVLKVRNPAPENALKLHEINTQTGIATGSSALWASNPDNTIVNNHFGDTEGFGMWLAFPAAPVGVSSNVPLLPYRMQFGVFDENVSQSNNLRGVMIDNVEVDDLGTVAALQYASTTPDGENSWDNLQRFSITGLQLWKNGSGNMWDRVVWPTFAEIVSADSSGKFFSGSGSDGKIIRSLLVGSSLNDFSARPQPWMGPPTALATYHSAFDMQDNLIVNFNHVEDKTSGAFATDDYYIRPVEKGQIRNTNNLLINSHPGYRSDASIDEEIAFNFAQGFAHYVFASALWDPYGYWGDAGNWSVYNRPFLTHNANCSTIPLNANASSCEGDYFGVDQFILDQVNMPFDDLMAIQVTRYDESNPEQVIDTWEVTSAQPGWPLGHMRHFAVREDGIYLLDFPDSSIPEDVALSLANMHLPAASFTLGIRYSGAHSAEVFTSTHDHVHYITDGHAAAGSWANKHDYVQVANRQQVIASAGETYWQDTVNQIVWVKVSYADLVQFNAFDPGDPYADEVLYNQFHLRVWSED